MGICQDSFIVLKGFIDWAFVTKGGLVWSFIGMALSPCVLPQIYALLAVLTPPASSSPP
jgi:hypothetical protein